MQAYGEVKHLEDENILKGANRDPTHRFQSRLRDLKTCFIPGSSFYFRSNSSNM